MRFDIKQDSQGQWRWTSIGDNGEPTAQSESYTRKTDAFRAARDFATSIVKQVTGQDWADLDIEKRVDFELILREEPS